MASDRTRVWAVCSSVTARADLRPGHAAYVRLHWLHEPAKPRAAEGSPEWAAAEVARMEEAAEERLRKQIAGEGDDAWPADPWEGTW